MRASLNFPNEWGNSASPRILLLSSISRSRSNNNNLWREVQEAVSSFVEAIPEGDHLTIIVFGDNADSLGIPSEMNVNAKDSFIRLIKQSEPRDGNTDLGKGLDESLKSLNRVGGNKLKFVFFLTDFNHDPPTGSPYQSNNPKDAVWQSLARRRQNELAGTVLEVYALLLPLGKSVGLNIDLGREVFPTLKPVRIVSGSKDSLSQWFASRRAEIARDKLKAFVEDDLRKQHFELEKLEAKFSWLGSDGQLLAWLRPVNAKFVGLTRLHIEQLSLDFGAEQPHDFEIIPRNGQEVSFHSSDEPQAVVIADLRASSVPLIIQERRQDAQVVLQGQEETAPADEIQHLNLSNQTPFKMAKTLPVSIKRGRISIPTAIGALLFIAGLVSWGIYYCRSEYIVGEVAVAGITKRKVLKTEKKIQLVVGNVQRAEGIPVPDATWRLALRAFRPCGGNHKQRGVYARMEAGTASVVYRKKRETIGTEWVRLARGSTVEVAGKRVTWS